MENKYPPVIIFAYNRPKELQQTIEALFDCEGIGNHEVTVFCDGAKNEKDLKKTEEVLSYLKAIRKVNNISIFPHTSNRGLAQSVITGVSKIFETSDAVIVLEDDLIVAPNFLSFMNQALDFYKNDAGVFSISGYSPKINFPPNYQKDFYFSPRASSWGWASWKDRWQTVDWEVRNYQKFKYDLKAQWQFTRGGIDLPRMLRNQMKGKINSWAIRWVYQQFLNNQTTVYPRLSKVISIGIGENATHTKKTKRFDTDLDSGTQNTFIFEKFNKHNWRILFSFRKVFSMTRRIFDKIN